MDKTEGNAVPITEPSLAGISGSTPEVIGNTEQVLSSEENSHIINIILRQFLGLITD
ncbi:hypothetical protein NXW59_22445 [Bacteroides fragilis]|nr:hypothetical protein [Bacteroides fragilis]